MISTSIYIVSLSFLATLIYFLFLINKKGESRLQLTLDSIILYFLNIFLLSYIVKYSVWLINDFSIELLRRATRNMGPLTFFAIDYYLSEHFNIAKLQYISLIPSIIILPYLTIGLINGFKFLDFTGFGWSYHALIHWSIAFLLATLLFYRKTNNSITSLDFGFQSIMATGWIYELPVCHVLGMFYSLSYPTFIMPQIISLAILIWILNKYSFHPNKIFISSTIVFLIFSLIYGLQILNGFPLWFRRYIPRIPATIMFLSTITGIQGQKK